MEPKKKDLFNLDFIPTIEEDDDINVATESEEEDQDAIKIKKKKTNKKNPAQQDFHSNFSFDIQDNENSPYESSNFLDGIVMRKNAAALSTSLDEKIAKIRKSKKHSNAETNSEISKTYCGSDVSESESENEEQFLDKVNTKEKKRKHLYTDSEKIQYSDEVTGFDKEMSFQDMNLSRPLLKALSAMNFSTPTPIQAATIPVALLNKDVCACAATGTGKTAAFMLPVLERLLFKPKSTPQTRVLVLTPTRELAVQIYQVSRQLAQFTNIDISLSAGGMDVKSQEAALRFGPDVVIATPGRLIDHVHNAPSFNLLSVEILILDEADRMLDEYFAEQMKEVIRLCSRTRQTMLFSATMTEEVNALASVSLNQPTRIFVNQNTDVALNLRQEFVRIRSNKEGDREAIVSALVSRTFHDQCMVFIQTKRQAHRMHVLLGLLGIRVGELHGNLSQPQRLEALRRFKESEIDVLLATDLAARGLDIEKVKTVINFTMPNSLKHYIHRVGRTARAGKSGRSVTLVGEKERKLLKEIVKQAKTPVKSRVIPTEVINRYRKRISDLETDVTEVMRLEAEEKEMRISELQVNKARSMIEHKEEIMSRPKRTWFQSHRERQKEKESLRLADFSNKPSDKSKRPKKPISAEDRVEYEMKKSFEFSARSAKKANREKRIHAFDEDDERPKKKLKRKSKMEQGKKIKKSSFEKDLTNTSKKSVRRLRAGPSYEDKKEMGFFDKKHGKKKPTGGSKSRSRYKKRR